NTYWTFCNTPSVICVAATGPTSDANATSPNPNLVRNGPWTNIDAPAYYTNFGRSVINVAAPGGNSSFGPPLAAPAGRDVGVWFAKAIFTKLGVTLAWGFVPVPTASDRWQHIMPVLVTKYAEGNPIGFFREFLLNTVVPNSHLYAQLTAFGEAAVGLGLVF